MDILDEVKALEEAVAVLKRVDLYTQVYGARNAIIAEAAVLSLEHVIAETKAREMTRRNQAERYALHGLIARGGACRPDACLPGCPIACVSEMSDDDVLRLARERLAEIGC